MIGEAFIVLLLELRQFGILLASTGLLAHFGSEIIYLGAGTGHLVWHFVGAVLLA